MGVLFIIILVILLFISILYLSLIVQVKINITISEVIIIVNFKFLMFHKNFLLRFNYREIIKKYFTRLRDREKVYKKRAKYLKSILKAFFIKNIDVYPELYEEKIALAISFDVVNIITKKSLLNNLKNKLKWGVLSE